MYRKILENGTTGEISSGLKTCTTRIVLFLKKLGNVLVSIFDDNKIQGTATF